MNSLERGHSYIVNCINILKPNERGRLKTSKHIDQIANDLRSTGCCKVRVLENITLKVWYNNRIVFVDVCKHHGLGSSYDYPPGGESLKPLCIVEMFL